MNILCLSFFLLWHPLHIAVTELDYNADSKSIEITHKIFIDDFEDGVEEAYGVKLQLGSPKEHREAATYIQKYIESNFSIGINDDGEPPSFVGYEIDYEAIWVYQELAKVRRVKQLTVWSRFLFNIFDDQRNIVHFKYLEEKKSFLFGKNDSREEAKF